METKDAGPALGWLARRTLFQRVLLAQTLAAVVLALVLGTLFYVERNITVARLVGERWGPALAQAIGRPGATALPLAVRSADALPADARHANTQAPRWATLARTLGRHGVVVADMAYQVRTDPPTVWLQVLRPDGTPQWLGFGDRMVEPRIGRRLVIGVLLGALVVGGISWWLARRIARPLESLRQRMQQLQPGRVDAPPPNLPGAAGAEIAAMDAAWRELQARLAQHERERALLLAGVSHDLRSPLARIRMAAELLPDDPAVAARREAIVRNCGVADRLVESFLDHVRAGELPLNDTVDVAALARQVVDQLGLPPEQLALQAPPHALLPHANHLLIERVLANLLDNALKHGKPPVLLRVAEADGQLTVDVHDAGPGIPEGARDTLQQAFARGDASRGAPGTGLGLAVVRQVALRMGGTLRFERADQGHMVGVQLPLQPFPPAG